MGRRIGRQALKHWTKANADSLFSSFDLPMMAQIHTHYDNLKVARNAPPEVIRAAYKTLSQKYHPDRHGNSSDAIRVIQIINSAYAVLSDPDKRREHDEWIARTEGLTQAQYRPEYMDVHTGREERRPSRRRYHRKSFFFDFGHSNFMPPLPLLRAIHKARMAVDQFSRKLSRKLSRKT